jgi:hypothetical protein
MATRIVLTPADYVATPAPGTRHSRATHVEPARLAIATAIWS